MSHRISGRETLAILILLLLAFALRTVDLLDVPPGLHNDEVVEIQMTEQVAGGRLGVFFPEETGHEALYYYFSAPFVLVFGSTVFAMRLLAVFISMVSMCVIWALARRLMGPVAALTALAGFAVVFWTVEFGRLISHVTMVVPLAALAAYFFWRAHLATGRRALLLWALSGLWLGLSINTYTAARALPPIFVAFGVYALVADRAGRRRWWQGIAITLAVAAVVVLPLALYLVRHPAADQLSFFDIDRPLVELRQGNLGPAIETSLKTLGMFAFTGDPLPYFDIPDRPIFEPVGALLLAAGLVIALWRWRQPKYAFVVIWFFLSLAPGMLSQPAPNYPRTQCVQPVLFILPGIAVASLLDRWRNVFVYAALALLFAGNLAWTARDYFTVWPSLDVVRFWHQSGLKAVADRLADDAGTSPVAVCVPDHLINESEPWWKPAWQHMRYLLHRPDLSLRYYNCADAMVLIDGPARYAFPDAAAVDELGQWPVYSQVLADADPDPDVLPDRLGVIVRSDVDTTYSLAQAGLGRPNGHVERPVMWAPETGQADHPAQAPVNFQDQVEFLGYDLSASSLQPGDSFDLTTYWRVIGGPSPRLSQFTHVLNAEGGIVAQQDRLAITSASLHAGDVFAQIHHLTLPGDVPQGEYPLAIGLYTPSDGVRLQIRQASEPRGDRLWLMPITVKR